MTITNSDKIKLILKIYSILYKLPLKTAFKIFFKPADSVRYWEFNYLLKYLKNNNSGMNLNILDVSSPFILSYIMSKKNKILKTDINNSESQFIKENKNLKFKTEDATCLSFEDNTFDLVFSISVIEHIYKKYTKAVEEMLRVTRPGGIVYLSFPVSEKYSEEWIDNNIYSDQYKNGGKTFFQYRFDEEHFGNILSSLYSIIPVSQSIYREKVDGNYDKIIKKLKDNSGAGLYKFIKNSILNLKSGFSLLNNYPSEFTDIKFFGNMSVILKK